MRDKVKYNLTLDFRMILDALRKKESDICADITAEYICETSIADICRLYKLNRYRVKKELDKGLHYLKGILRKEGYYKRKI